MNFSIMKLLLLLPFIALIFRYAESYPIEQNENAGEDSEQLQQSENQSGLAEQDSAQFYQYLIEKYPNLMMKLYEEGYKGAKTNTNNMQQLEESSDNSKTFSRERRRLNVFKNIYQQCRIQKRKEKDLCLYLANLYQNVKGFHGL